MMGLDTPVALIVFNRPEPTRRLFEAVAKVRPRTLLLVADGARPAKAGEAERVAEVRAIVEGVDWPCEIHRNFSEVNLGCRERVSSGLDWVFRTVDRAIILEDDCIPAPAFWSYCEDMLERYADEPRVFSISGTCFGDAAEPGHYFSRFALMWGWATWADRWRHYRNRPRDVRQVVAATWPDLKRRLFWTRTIERVDEPAHSTWDWQWILTLWRHGAVAVRPSRNLVENIGFGADATHTHGEDSPLRGVAVYEGDASFARPLGPLEADRGRDAHDERVWAGVSWRTVLALHAPWLLRARRMLG